MFCKMWMVNSAFPSSFDVRLWFFSVMLPRSLSPLMPLIYAIACLFFSLSLLNSAIFHFSLFCCFYNNHRVISQPLRFTLNPVHAMHSSYSPCCFFTLCSVLLDCPYSENTNFPPPALLLLSTLHLLCMSQGFCEAFVCFPSATIIAVCYTSAVSGTILLLSGVHVTLSGKKWHEGEDGVI